MTKILKPCPFCGDVKDLQILNQGDLVNFECHYQCPIEQKRTFAALAHTWFVNCPTCGACGPDFYVGGIMELKSDDECKEAAIEAWNKRSNGETV